MNAPLDIIPLMIRGGFILPAQKPANTTTNSRKNNFELLITLDHMNEAKGELYWDDGDTLGIYCINIIISFGNYVKKDTLYRFLSNFLLYMLIIAFKDI